MASFKEQPFSVFILLGAEFNAELERSRKLEAGETTDPDQAFVEHRS